MNELFGEQDPLDAVVAELRQHHGWPADDRRDRQFVKELADKFPAVDLKLEAYNWRVWMMDHESKKEVKPRARFVTWVRNAESFRATRASARSNRRNPSRTAPARRELFGTEPSAKLTSW